MTKQKKIAFALQGGGAHGAFAWGVLDQFLEDGRFWIEGISGTSAGGMNAVAYLQGIMDGGLEGARKSLHEFWKTLSDVASMSPFKSTSLDQMVGYFNLDHSIPTFYTKQILGLFSPYQLNQNNWNPLEIIIRKCFTFDRLQKYRDAFVFLCATHVATGKLKIFANKDLSVNTLLASACLPRLFQAVEVNHEFYWDGGYAGNPAIYPLINGCKTQDIIVVQLTKQHCPKVPKTRREIEDRLMEINNNISLLREMRAISFQTKLIDEGLIKGSMKRLYMHMIRNEDIFIPLSQESALNADWKFIMYLFEWGKKTAKKLITDHFDQIGFASSLDIEKEFVEEEG